MQRSTYTDTPIPPDEAAGENPPDGAIVDYYLPSAASNVTLEILDSQGHAVRRFSSTDHQSITQEELQKQLIPLYWIRMPRKLSTEPGMHRWVWDLHYPAPVSTRHDYPISAVPHDTPRGPLGPTALPGNYSVRLTVDGKVLSAALTLKMDPRVKTSAAGLEKKFKAEGHLASIVSDSSRAVIQGGAIREQVEKLKAQASAPLSDSLEAFQKKLTALLGTPGGFFAPPSQEVTLNRVNSQAGRLYQQIWQVDAEPTTSQEGALTAVQRDGADVLKRWSEFATPIYLRSIIFCVTRKLPRFMSIRKRALTNRRWTKSSGRFLTHNQPSRGQQPHETCSTTRSRRFCVIRNNNSPASIRCRSLESHDPCPEPACRTRHPSHRWLRSRVDFHVQRHGALASPRARQNR